MEYAITKEEFIDTYLDDMKVLEIIEDMGPMADKVSDYDELVTLINQAYSDTLDKYVCEDDGLIHEINFRTFDSDLLHELNKKIGE